MVIVENLSKSYIEQSLFTDASFTINPKERLGLVGRNGHGKTTLLRILTGQEKPDSGTVRYPDGYRLGYLSQHIRFSEPTVLQEACKGLTQATKYDDWKVKKILMGLEFGEDDWDRSPSEFSGGYQLRINLAKALVSEPDFLLLDEPTNFLDIVSIRWMIKFLNQWPGELLIISHDRSFMDSVVTHILGIHRQKIKKIPGKTGDYYQQIEHEETFYEKERENEAKKRKHTEEFIDRFRYKATKARQVQSRIKALDRMGEKEKLSKISDLSFGFKSLPFAAKSMLSVYNLSFGYEADTTLFDKLSFTVQPYERVCIIGKNGKGKTTLLKVLTGHLQANSGTIKTHPSLVSSYFEQANTALLHPDWTVEQEIVASLERKNMQEAKFLAGLMMFPRDQMQKKTSVLSGGEKSRVLLGKLLASPAHLLLLDEPTHHLDMQSSEAMADAILNFNGSSIVVTHDENFLHRVATKLIVFHQDRAFVYQGTYREFLNEVGWGDEPVKSKASTTQSVELTAKEARRIRAEKRAKRQAVLGPLETKIKKFEKQIARLEKNFAEQNELMLKASIEQNSDEIVRLSKVMHELRLQIDFGYLELEKASQEYEKRKRQFIENID